MKKSIICVIIGVVIGLAIAVAFGVGLTIGKNGGTNANSNNVVENKTKEETKAANENATSGQSQTGGNAENKTESKTENKADIKEISGVKINAEKKNSWGDSGNYFAQFDVTVKNDGAETIKGWEMLVDKHDIKSITQYWNCEVSEGDGGYVVVPAQYNQELKSGSETVGMGIVVNSSNELDSLDIKVIGADSNQNKQEDQSKQDDSKKQDDQNNQNNQNDQDNKENTTPVSVASKAVGKLSVSGTSIVDSSGNAVQLRGVSTHGLAWYPEYVNKAAFETLKNDWGANVVRLAMYTDEYGGYCNGGDRDKLKKLIDDGVNYATELGMYVIIDWHILNDNNPQTHKSDAIQFFDEISAKYANHDNVIYEICNEPHWVSWNNDIKPYAEEVIKVIRSHTKDAIILVGTNTWSQDVDDVIGNEINDDNIMYVVHFYAATHKDDIRNKMMKAKNAGIPVFVSECSICDASGNGGIDETSANQWLALMNENNISFIAWSLSNKQETSALIKSGCSKTSGWSDDELSDCGRWFKNAILGK